MLPIQKGILDEVPQHARYMAFTLKSGADVANTLNELVEFIDGESVVLGLGVDLIASLNAEIPHLHDFPEYPSASVEIPSTPASLWIWLRGKSAGELILESRKLRSILEKAFDILDIVDAFKHGIGQDLTGYEDGTENPEGEEAIEAGFSENGDSYVAVQKWVHDFNAFNSMSTEEQDLSIGRQISDNEEIEDAPKSAHVKRTEQESFDPDAIVLRRSMPWADTQKEGLNFVAFGKDFRAFEVQMNRMAGSEDGIVDALFKFTTPVTGSYFWCPPMNNGKPDLRAIGL